MPLPSHLGAAARGLLGASLVCLAGASARAEALRIESRDPAGLLVLTAPGRSPAASTGALLTSADEALAVSTRLELRSLEQLGVDALSLDPCREGLRLSCWARTVRAKAGRDAPRFVFVLALIPIADGREQASLLLLDTEHAAGLFERADRADPDWEAAVEDELFAATPRSPPARLDLTDPRQRAAYFSETMQGSFRRALEAAGVFTGLGRIEVQGTRAGWSLFVDGRPVGRTGEGRTEVLGVPAGHRRVEVAVPWGEPAQAELTVQGARAVTMTVAPPPLGVHPARIATRWGGLAVAATGVAVMSLGLARASDGARVTCLRRAGDVGDCAGLGTPTTGYDPGSAPATDPRAVDAGGLALVPFGLALAVAGGGASAAAWLSLEETEFPWWEILIGVAAGGLTYGIGHAAGR